MFSCYSVLQRRRLFLSSDLGRWSHNLCSSSSCPNKVPRMKRQAASVSKKAREPSDLSNNHFLSGHEHPPKVKFVYNNDFLTQQHHAKVKCSGMVSVKQQQHETLTSKQHSHGRKLSLFIKR